MYVLVPLLYSIKKHISSSWEGGVMSCTNQLPRFGCINTEHKTVNTRILLEVDRVCDNIAKLRIIQRGKS